jgi:Arm DNA-binding domain
VTKKKTPGASGGENEASEVERFLLAGPTDRVLHGEILAPKGKGSRAVAAPRQTGRAISTDIQAKDARPGIHKISKSTGFYLKVSESGSASYFWRYRFAGKRREIGLGSRKDVSLAEARAEALRQDIADAFDDDPETEWRTVIEAVVIRTCSSPGGYVSHETQWQGRTKRLGQPGRHMVNVTLAGS